MAGQEAHDVTSMVQVSQMVKRRSDYADEEPGADLEGAASAVSSAKMLYKRRLTEREMAFHKFEAAKNWAQGRIAAGTAQLAEVKKKAHWADKTSTDRRDAAKNVWTRAFSEMLETEDAVTQGELSVEQMGVQDITKMKAGAEKYAEDALKHQLEEELLAKKSEDERTGVAQVTASDLAADTAAWQQAQLDKKTIKSEVDMQVLAEEDIIKDKARSDKVAKSLVKPVGQDLDQSSKKSLLEVEAHVTANNERNVLADASTEAAVEQSREPRSHVAIVLEAVGDIADRTRMSLYGEVSERAVRLASAKMVYKKTLFMHKLAAKELSKAKATAKAMIHEGKKSLKRVAKNRRETAVEAERKVNEAKAQWEALAAKVNELASSEDGQKLEIAAEKKAEHSLKVTLEKEQKADMKARIAKRSKAEKAAGQKDQMSDTDALKQANLEWTGIAKKVDADVSKLEKLIAKENHAKIGEVAAAPAAASAPAPAPRPAPAPAPADEHHHRTDHTIKKKGSDEHAP